METLNLSQITFFNHLLKSRFKNNVLRRADNMGLDGAFYFSLGEQQSAINNFSFDNLSDDQQEEFISALIIEMPELEF